MDKTTLERLFTGKFFKVPRYQRDYAWSLGNVDDLFNDVAEALETNTSHYIGTFILSHRPGEQVYNLVDGQQRLTTLTMLIHALVKHLPASEQTAKILGTDRFLASDGKHRLELLGDNEAFFREILDGKTPDPRTGSQRRLRDAYAHIDSRVAKLAAADATQIKRWLKCVGELEVMEFIEDDDGRAIRIFQTVNDRGKPLSNMEKAKSLLIYYSNRFLGGALDALVNDEFGEIFRAYESIKEQAKMPGREIDLVNQAKFTEDTVMRYHFIALPSAWHDYGATANEVLDGFLKGGLKEAQSKGQAELSGFIEWYVSDLRAFFAELEALVRKVGNDVRYYKLLSWLNLSATLYPLLVRLAMRGLLEQPVPSNEDVTFRDLIEIVDVRVYKTRGTNPERDMAVLAQAAMEADAEHIANTMLGFVKWGMGDAAFRAQLEGNEMVSNKALWLMLLEYELEIRKKVGLPAPDAGALQALAVTGVAIEHVFAQEPTFKLPGRGFDSKDDYKDNVHRLGNLTMLEEAINSRARNRSTEAKAQDDKLYKLSEVRMTRELGAEILNRHSKGKLWEKADIEARTSQLADFVIGRWPLWKEA